MTTTVCAGVGTGPDDARLADGLAADGLAAGELAVCVVVEPLDEPELGVP
jgi:hypothetical protein